MDRYEEALERAKQGLPIDEVFPELKGSEDERIRKRIRLCLDECVHSDIIRDYERDECFAYLEKQKEQNRGIDFSRGYEQGFSEAKRKYEQKPAEWSEEDKTMLERCISKMACIIPVPGKHGLTNMSFEKHTDEKLAAWLKSLPERFNLQPKQEWSEEDMEMIGSIGSTLALNIQTDTSCKKIHEKELKWFNELYQRGLQHLHWKPSEEQMKALNEVANDGVLLDLFNDLLKLL